MIMLVSGIVVDLRGSTHSKGGKRVGYLLRPQGALHEGARIIRL